MRRAIVVLLMLLPACRDPYVVDRSHTTRTEPKPADLVGIYVPEEATRELISKVGGYPARTTSIALDAGGSIRITNIPDWWQTSPRVPSTGFDSGSGTWKLHTSEGYWGLSLDFPSMQDFDSDRVRAAAQGRPEGHPDVALTTGALLVGEQPPYMIELVIRRRGVNGVMRFQQVPTAGGSP